MEIGDISYEKAEFFFYLSSPSKVTTCTRKIKKTGKAKKDMEKSYCNRNGLERTQLEHHPPTIKGQREVERIVLSL